MLLLRKTGAVLPVLRAQLPFHAPPLAVSELPASPGAAVTLQAARNGTCELCLKTMDLFIGAYGSEASVLADWATGCTKKGMAKPLA